MLGIRAMMGAGLFRSTALVKNGAFNTDAWEIDTNTANGTVTVVDGKLRASVPGTSTGQLYIKSKFSLSGDFSTHLSCYKISHDQPSSSTTLPSLFQIKGVSDDSYVGYEKSSGGLERIVQGGSTTGWGPDPVTKFDDTAFLLRRTSSVIKGYYLDNSQWEWDGSISGFTFSETNTDTVNIVFGIYNGDDAAIVTDFTYFVIATGTIVWP